MGYEVRPDGTIVALTLDDAIALSKRLREDSTKATTATVAPSTAPKKDRPRRSKTSPEDIARKAKALLGALESAGKAGLGSADLAKQIGLANPKGLSAYVAAAKRAIKDKGVARPEKVVWRKRTAKEGATWHVNGEKLKEIGLM